MYEMRTRTWAKGKGIIKPAGWTLLAFLLLMPSNIFGQMASPQTIDGNARFSASASTSYQFMSSLDGGGDLTIAHYGFGVGGARPLNDKAGLGVRLNYDREEYNFSNVRGFAVSNPWNQINRLGLGLRLGYRLTDEWSLGGGPIIQYAGEEGAGFGDSLMYGVIVSALYRANPDFIIGFGAGVFYRLEETRTFPSLIISWKINDRLRLGNSYRLGPAGPAGLELSYKLNKNWEAAAGGGLRSSRFRLDKDGPIPGGIGENRSWPVYGRIGLKLGSVFHLDLNGGTAFAGEIKLQDSSGQDINSVHYQPIPLVGFNLRTIF
jgi:hypothetical protein